MRIGEIKGAQSRMEPVEGSIFSMSDSRTVNLRSGGQAQVCEAVLRDDTGSVTLTLWDSQIKMIKPGSKVRIENGYVTTFRGKNTLNIGKYGLLHVLEF